MISIITAAYNAANSISTTIESVLKQTEQDWEYLIIDDGSTDNTKDVISKYNNSKLSYHYQRNKGVTAARNLGINKAKGEYIIFLDADDTLFENAIKDFNTYLTRNQNVGIISGHYIHSPNILVKPKFRGEIFYNHKLNILVGSYVVSKKILEAVGGYDDKLSYSENWELFIRLIKFCENNNFKIITGEFLTFKYNFNNSNDKNLCRKRKILDSYIYLYEKYKKSNNCNYNYSFSFAETIALTAFQIEKRKLAMFWQGEAIKNNKRNLKAYFKYVRYLLNIKNKLWQRK